MREIKCLVLGVDYYQDNNFNYYMEELKNLVDAANFTVVHQFSQKLDKIDPKTYFKKGKINEVSEWCQENEVQLIIINNEISGMCNRNIEELTGIKVMDRTQLILEIFATRAQTKEAKLQVSIAQLKYNLPRMVGSYDNLSRQGGGKVGTIARGSGEKKIEVDKRRVRDQINFLEEELLKYEKARDLQREKRAVNQIPIVAVVGYTNAGKSTLMNYFVNEEKQVFEKNMLFATLDTSVRRIKLEDKREFLLVDTVGFVSHLPHDLVKAFGSTLEEVAYADLIVHLEDGISENRKIHEKVVNDTLKSLKVDAIPKINVINKGDILTEEITDSLVISARTGMNIDELIKAISNEIYADYQKCIFEVPYDMLKVMDQIRQKNQVENIEYLEKTVRFECEISVLDAKLYQKYIVG